jgi:hypothetical protein
MYLHFILQPATRISVESINENMDADLLLNLPFVVIEDCLDDTRNKNCCIGLIHFLSWLMLA